MARYIQLLNWTDQGVKNIKDSPNRLDAAKALAKKMGCEIREFYMTVGAYDMVVTAEAPNDETFAKFALSLAMGAISAPQPSRPSPRTPTARSLAGCDSSGKGG